MLKKLAFVLVTLLVLPTMLVACGSDSVDTGKDYVEAVLNGNAEAAQKYACEDYQDVTATLVEEFAAQIGEGRVIQNVDLKYDIGKGGNQKEVIATGAYEVAELNAQGKVVADSENEYVVASSTRDKYDLNGNNDDEDRLNTRIVLTMKEDGGDWCVAGLEGGYFSLAMDSEG